MFWQCEASLFIVWREDWRVEGLSRNVAVQRSIGAAVLRGLDQEWKCWTATCRDSRKLEVKSLLTSTSFFAARGECCPPGHEEGASSKMPSECRVLLPSRLSGT